MQYDINKLIIDTDNVYKYKPATKLTIQHNGENSLSDKNSQNILQQFTLSHDSCILPIGNDGMVDHNEDNDVEGKEEPVVNQLVVGCGWEAGLSNTFVFSA